MRDISIQRVNISLQRPIVFETNIDIHFSLSNQPIRHQNKQFNIIIIKRGRGNAFILTLPDERVIRIISMTGVKKYTRDADWQIHSYITSPVESGLGILYLLGIIINC